MEVTTPLNAQMTFTKTRDFDGNASNSKVVYLDVVTFWGDTETLMDIDETFSVSLTLKA